MKAILLAAGCGTRISRMIDTVPKSTLPINGKPLIRITVEMLESIGIECVICVGYKKEKIYEALDGLNLRYYENPFYDITNSIASLWFAENELNDDMLILNADVFFSKKILELILSDSHSNVLAIDKTRIKTGDYFFKTTNNGCIKKYGKDLPINERSCEYVGIAKMRSDFVPYFQNRLDEMIKNQQHNKWWENILYSFTDNNEQRIYTVDVNGLFWSEIDYFDDYERILNHLDTKNAMNCNELLEYYEK